MRFLLHTSLLIGLLAGCRTSMPDLQPNIILIIADDMNWDDCGVYGHPHIKTPNIDNLAKQGLRFNHAYLTVSSCSPSRASIITGRYPHNTGAEQLHWALPPNSETFVAHLKKSGYYTAASGKWHLGPHIRDHFDGISEASVSGFQLPTSGEVNEETMVAPAPSGCEQWLTTLKERPKDQPFFMWFAAIDPHRSYKDSLAESSHSTSAVIVPPYLPDTRVVRDDFRQYYDEIGRLDHYVGEVMNELRRQQIDSSTVVIFISDNGRPFPRDKTTLYQGGIKTPLLVRWPQKVVPGSISQSLVSAVDFAPTILDLAGLPASELFEGKSFLATILEPSTVHREYAFAEDHWHDYTDHGRAIISNGWKLIRNDYTDLPATPSADIGRSITIKQMNRLRRLDSLSEAQQSCFIVPRPTLELYNLRDDPFELRNLAYDSSYVQKREELLNVLGEWVTSTNDFIPSRRTPDEFDRATGMPDHSVRKRPRPDKKAMFGTYGKY